MIKILHYLKDPKLWELWYSPCYGACRIYEINRSIVNIVGSTVLEGSWDLVLVPRIPEEGLQRRDP